jgi:hypothetical protein
MERGFDIKLSRYPHNTVTFFYYTVSSNPDKEGGNIMPVAIPDIAYS